MHLTVCYYRFTYAYESESTLCSCLNVKEMLARRRREHHCEAYTWRDKNMQSNARHRYVLRTQLKYLVNLAKWLSVHLQTKWFWVRVQFQSLEHQIWLSVGPNAWVFIYELRGSGFESSCSRINLRVHACVEERTLWHWSNYRVWIHSETRTWHDKNIQSNAPYR